MEVRLLPPEPATEARDRGQGPRKDRALSEIACSTCGTLNPEGFRFCGSCGSPLAQSCPVCGATNPHANRFCGTCGSALGEEPAVAEAEREERKVVSMLFADLTASTEMASRLDPEDLRAVLRPFYDAMVEEIERYGGTVQKFIGDAVVAAFGAPAAHEDDPERAIACALAMQRRLEGLNADLSERAGGDLAMRIGINTGEVLAHSIEEGIVTGEAVNIAARFQSLAEPGRVVVGDRTWRDARDAFSFTDLGEVEVKGIERPLRVFRVEGEVTSRPAPGAGSETPFVGRGSEMDLLRLLFARTLQERRPNLVTIAGPPGIGKSRLAHEAARALEGEGALVVRGRCLPYGDGLTYWPLAEILRADAGILDSDPAERTIEKARARLEPRFAGEDIGVTNVLLSSIGVPLSPDPLAGTEQEAAQHLIVRAWQRYLETVAGDRPLVALVEDVHWADPSLLQLLETLIARASGPMLVVCMARPELFERRRGWGGGLSNATAISLSPLTAADGTALIDHLLGGHAPAEVVGPILQRSEGNPFFAGELLRMMVEDGTLARGSDGWALVRELPSALPDTVQSVIASRIDMLAPEEKRAIQDASVIGRTFWVGGITRLGTRDADRSVDGLVAKGLVRERDRSSVEGERELIFSHVLIRDVAYASIPRSRRAQAHAIVGGWMEEGTAGRLEEFAEILAHHFSLAEDLERTARYGLLAGQRLLRVFAAAEAIAWFDRAMDAAAGSAGPRSRAEIAIGRALAKEQLGRFEEAKADYELAAALSREARDDALEARALAAIPHVLWLLDRFDEGQALLPEALERARAVGNADAEVRLLYTAGTMRFGRGEFADAVPLHQEALEAAVRSEDLDGQALAHHGLCETFFFQGPFEAGLEHGLEADRLFRELGLRPMVAHNGYMVAWVLGFVGRPDEAMATVNASIEIAAEMGSGRETGFALTNRAELHLSAGRLDAAMADAERALSHFRDLGLARGEMVSWFLVAEIAAEAWDLERIAEASRAGLAISDRLGGTFMRSMQLAFAAWAALSAGTAGAEELLEQARTTSPAFLDRAWSGRCEVLAREWSGDPRALGRTASRIEREIRPHSSFWGAWGLYARAAGALGTDDAREAAAVGLEALEVARAVGEARLRWRSAAVVARALSGLGRDEEAETFRKEAVGVLEEIAANASGRLRESFLARRDVAALLG